MVSDSAPSHRIIWQYTCLLSGREHRADQPRICMRAVFETTTTIKPLKTLSKPRLSLKVVVAVFLLLSTTTRISQISRLPRLIDKDSYDIYAISGFYGGDPTKASENYLNRFKEEKLTTRERNVIQLSMNRISQAFRTIDSYGVFAVSRFVGANISSDVHLRTSTFLKSIGSSNPVR